MPLESGRSVGAYEVIGLLGAGGMGEVYRARDTKLGRDVALKILPDSFSTDPERLARFQREAQVLASLNHPQIGAIYGLEDANGQRALVLELVEGPTLADRIAQGPVPAEEALPIARQIVEALEAAHEQGVVHRDLKPANIKLRPDGVVKVLDFGLAAVAHLSSGPAASATQSPTLTLAATRVGVILGTAAYMSPEQASGKPVDKRTDIWSFGVVLWEMLTGRRLFDGETISHTLADVLRSHIDFKKLPTDTPQAIQDLLQRCLDRNAFTRLRDMGEARIQIERVLSDASHGTEAHDSAPSAHRRPWWRRAIPVAATGVLAAVIAGAAAWHARPSPTLAVTRFPLTIGEGQTFAGVNRSPPIVISPDGSEMAYLATSQQRTRLYLRSMSEVETRPIPGADGGNLTNAVFSPDGRSLAFWSADDRALKRIGISGGAAATICPSDNPSGMSWDEGGIVFGQLLKGIMRVSPNGGTPELIASVESDEQAYGPQMLPGGRALLFTLARGSGPDRWDKAQIVFQVLSSGERKILVEGGSNARYLPTGHLVYALRGVLFAVPFDLRRLEVTGAPVSMVEGVSRGSDTTGVAHFSFSASGTLIYLPGPVSTSADHRLVLLDRNGGVEPLKLPPGSYEHPRVSPDGKRIVFGTDEGKEATVWIYDLSGTTALRRLTFGGRNRFPIWSADGQRVAFQSDREGDRGIFWQPADGSGTPERLTKANQGTSHVPESWSPKGETFSFIVSTGSTYSLSTLSLRDRTTMPFAMVQSSAPINSAFSPDGRWLAYTSAPRVGAPVKVLVEPFPSTGAKYEIAPRALFPVWSPDSRELLFTPQGQLVFVRIDTQPGFTFGNPVSLPVPEGFAAISVSVVKNYDIMPDGKRFVAALGLGQSGAFTTSQIQVVLNWFEELKQRVPTK